MQEFLYFFGHGFCHQLPERTLQAGGLYFSVCARDTGIYIGVLLSILATIIIYARQHPKPGNLPRWPLVVGIIALFIPMALDGVTSYAGWRETSNLLRYFTGLLAGIGTGTLMSPLLLAMRRDADTSLRAFDTPLTIALQLAMPLAAGMLFYLVHPQLGVASPLIALGAFLFFAVSLSLLGLGQSQRFAPRGHGRRWLLAVIIALLIVLAAVVVFGLFRHYVLDPLLDGQTVWQWLLS